MHETPITILLVEDNPGDACLVRELLRGHDSLRAEIIHVQRLREAVEELSRSTVDVILLDLSLPDSQGLQTVSRMLEAAPEVPVVVLTGQHDDELAREAVRAGAQDYLVKGAVGAKGLARVVRYARERKHRENEQRRTEDALSLLQRLTLALGQAEDLQGALRLVLQEVCEATGWAIGESWLPNVKQSRLERGPAVYLPDLPLQKFHTESEPFTFCVGEGLPGRVWRSAQPLWVPDASVHPDFCRRDLTGEIGVRAAILVPVLAGEEVAAILAFYHTEVREKDERLARLVASAAAPLGTIIQRRRTEQALRHSEAHLRRLMETAYEGIWLLDAEMRTEYVNPRLTWILGYTAEEMIGRPVYDFVGDEMETECRARLERRRRGESEASELRLRRKDGSEAWVHTSASPVQDEQGEFRGSFVTVTDIGERKRAEAAEHLLAEAGEVFSASLDYQETLEAICRMLVPRLADWCVIDVLDEAGAIQVVRIAAAEPRKQGLLETMLERFPHHVERESHPVGRVLQTGQATVVQRVAPELLEIFSTGPEHLELLRALDPRASMVVPLTANGRVIGAMTLSLSESGRLFVPGDLALAEELGRRAALAIVNARLYERARRALQARDEVLGFVAHDLRNPLGAIAMSAELLLDTGVAEPVRFAQIEGIRRAVHQMDRLIQDLLDVTRLESGRMRIEPVALALRPVLTETLEMLEARAAEHGVPIELEVVGSLEPVLADRQRLLQVLSNLLDNSLKFTPRGGRIALRAEPRADEVIIAVSNTGPIIAPEYIPHLFDRFWQGDPSPGSARGLGLGLPICKGLVEAHGGRIWVESDERSTVFSFTIPVARQAEPLQMAQGSTTDSEPRPPLRVIIADDHEIFLRSVELLLEGAGGFQVIARVTSGELALEEAGKLRPDLVLMDLAMPGMGGVEAMRRLSALDAAIRVVALTGNVEEMSLIEALEAGAVGYISKTASPEEMIAALRAAAAGEVHLDNSGNRLLLDRYREQIRQEEGSPLATLTDQERGLLALAAEGYTSVEIGKRLFLSPATVDSYRSRLMRKVGLRHRSDLVRFALQTGLLSAEQM
jgi:PAS domain S-box-containing protein